MKKCAFARTFIVTKRQNMKKIAVIATVFYPASHADVIVARWLYPGKNDAIWGFPGPQTELVSMHVVETPPVPVTDFPKEEWVGLAGKRDIDVSRHVSEAYGLPLTPTIEAALTLGTGKIAVDGVILIGEHGAYAFNELGQKLYPRYELFMEIARVFEKYGRSVPVFNDKHFSYDCGKAKAMMARADELGFLLFGASSSPLLPQTTPLDLPHGTPLKEAVAVYNGFFEGDREIYGYHSIEFAQSFVERRLGGESGIRSIVAYVGDALWERFDSGDLPLDLLEAAAGASHGGNATRYRENCAKSGRIVDGVVITHADGLRIVHVNLTGHADCHAIALRLGDNSLSVTGTIWGTAEERYAHFAALSRRIEDGILTGESPFPKLRPLLTTCTTAATMRAYAQPGTPTPTPELDIRYSS